MIPLNYYQGFTKLCDRNTKMTRIPSKEELEKAGCDISGMCYLVTKDGMQYNPSVVNPEIMSDDIRTLFTAPSNPTPTEVPTVVVPLSTLISEPATDIPKLDQISKGDPIGKFCPQCENAKSLEQFGEKVGRGGHRKDICIDCEAKNRLKALEDITKLEQHQEKEVKHEKPNATPISGEQLKERIKETITKEIEPSAVDHVGDNPNKPRYVTIEHVKELVTEAYQNGVKDGKQQSALNIIEPTLNDLLRA